MPNAEEFLAPVLDRAAAIAFREALRARGKIVVFTNGCFDVVHGGHTAYLAWARAQGDALIVGLNGDASVRGLKGPQRPFVPFVQSESLLQSVDAAPIDASGSHVPPGSRSTGQHSGAGRCSFGMPAPAPGSTGVAPSSDQLAS